MAFARSGAPLPPLTLAGFLAAAAVVVLIALFSFQSLSTRASTAGLVTHTLKVMEQLQALRSSVKDAETGQRGFLITGTESYLEPYTTARSALPGQIKSLRELLGDTPLQGQRLDAIERLIGDKLGELEQTVALRRSGDPASALAIVSSDRGKATMDGIRQGLADIERDEQALLSARQAEWRDAVSLSYAITWGSSALLLFLIAAGAALASRDHRMRETQDWLRAGQAGLASRIQGEQRLEVLGERVLSFLAEHLGAQVGAVYVASEGQIFRRCAAHAVEPSDDTVLRPGDGLIGQAAKDGRTLQVNKLPEGYLPIVSGLGRAQPRTLLLAPASADGEVQAVIELGFLQPVGAAERELLDRVSGILGVAVRSSKDRSRLEALLEETQRQAEELQAQQEELRVNNEELEEQERVLKASQAQLEIQQSELQQTNARLEAQTQSLENQKEELSQAQAVLTDKAIELERVNRYKTEFLANMSHELRTPLNSTLILAKLLADNATGNLTEEQVKFAQTISGAGNDLLTLINDILDLSKIEAGKIDVHVEPIAIAPLVEGLCATLEPLARDKGLSLSATVQGGTSERITTDGQRLGQILKNLLSNALKFTEAGKVSLHVFQETEGSVSFAVRDTGIGIAAHQQELIFEAFRQADGSTHRKYGGTGLGLSISRDLAHLLGGDLSVQSAPGEGSTFTLTLPLSPADRPRVPSASPAPAPAALPPLHPRLHPQDSDNLFKAIDVKPSPTLAPIAIEDDRANPNPSARLVLVIEDDSRFATILRDLAREMHFQCIVTHTASEGLSAALIHRPSAILLDVNLPDHSGLGVLDQLKHNTQTRHIPVHILSVADYTQAALERGAVGYDLKPVKRTQIVKALERLEAKFSQSMRRVLVVEDDARQRESIRQLLQSDEVQITTVETGQDALAQLKDSTFDCMIMDLNLPDLSGYELLERMAGQEEMAFPPVIVYTGRSLTATEEQKLRRFSKSIIIKDARSPERLLDEVTLFLHQVESTLPAEIQRMLKSTRDRDSTLEGRRILVVEDDVRNVFALTSVLEPKGAKVELARNGLEALEALERSRTEPERVIDLVLMDVMMPEMDGLTAMREIRKQPVWSKLPIIALTAKAMRDDQERCLSAGANDYIAKPLDVEKLLSLVRVWMPK